MPNPFAAVAMLALLVAAASPAPPQKGRAAPDAGRASLPMLRLPLSPHAERGPAPAAILDVPADGRVLAGGRALLAAGDAATVGTDATAELRAWLAELADGMEKAPLAEGSKVLVASEPLLLRVDAFAPFAVVQTVMELCGSADVGIPRIELAALKGDETDAAGFRATDERGDLLSAHLPTDLDGTADAEPVEWIEIVVTVTAPGAKVTAGGEPWTPEAGEPFVHDATRAVDYRVGPRRLTSIDDLAERLRALRLADPDFPLTIDARAGVTHGEVVAVINAARAAGCTGITFVGRGR